MADLFGQKPIMEREAIISPCGQLQPGKDPMARGVYRIPHDQKPILWSGI